MKIIRQSNIISKFLNYRMNKDGRNEISLLKNVKAGVDIKITYLGSRLKICRLLDYNNASISGKIQQKGSIVVWQKI